jgi:hypothetical protein
MSASIKRVVEMRKLLVLLALLGGCATFDEVRQDIHSRYAGRPLEEAIKRVGMPNREVLAAGRKAYVWEIGQGDCTLQMEVDKTDVVVDTQLHGYQETCESYRR